MISSGLINTARDNRITDCVESLLNFSKYIEKSKNSKLIVSDIPKRKMLRTLSSSKKIAKAKVVRFTLSLISDSKKTQSVKIRCHETSQPSPNKL